MTNYQPVSFEENFKLIEQQIDKRRAKWRLTFLEWADVRQMLLIHVNEKIGEFNPEKGKLANWVSRVVTYRMQNILRDHFGRYSRPCIKGCKLAVGDNGCSITSTKLQCAECPLYDKWQKKKESEFKVLQTLPWDNHSTEVKNYQGDFFDSEEAKKIIDIKIKDRLSAKEFEMYTLLYIENLEEIEVGERLGYKKCKNSDIRGYQQIRKLQKKVLVEGMKIIIDEDLA